MTWRPFSFGVVDLLTLDDKVGGDSGVIYSTAPRKALGKDNEVYFVKGPEREVVFAELAGCVLADAAGITVPSVRACILGGDIYAGSREVSALRLVAPWLQSHREASNFYELFSAIVVDVWLANIDRNMGNIVAEQLPRGKVELVFIDFEKSATLRPNPLLLSNMVPARQLWPTAELGQTILDRKPLAPPVQTVQTIRGIDSATCLHLLGPVIEALGTVEWAENSAIALGKRAERIHELSMEVWRP